MAQNWEVFKEEVEIYSNAALHDKTDTVKAYTLLNLAGAEAIKRSRTFVSLMTKDKVKQLTHSLHHRPQAQGKNL